MFIVKDSPLISMRFSGDEKIDSFLNTDKLITCNTQKAYTESAKLFKKRQELFARDKKFKIYNLYYGDINECLGCDKFIENTKKYPNNLFGIKIEKSTIQDNRGWIIKYGNYYYTFFVLDINFDDRAVYPVHVMWQKMTEKQLMNFNKSKY